MNPEVIPRPHLTWHLLLGAHPCGKKLTLQSQELFRRRPTRTDVFTSREEEMPKKNVTSATEQGYISLLKRATHGRGAE